MKLKPILITAALLLLPIPARGILRKMKGHPAGGKGNTPPAPEG